MFSVLPLAMQIIKVLCWGLNFYDMGRYGKINLLKHKYSEIKMYKNVVN